MTPQGIDPRGPRVGAGITAFLLAIVVLLGATPEAWGLLVLVTVGFGIGAVWGPGATWQGRLYRRWIAPRLDPPTEREDPRPPRFAQQVGFVICLTGVVLGLTWSAGAVPVAAAIALMAALLNAAFGLCLGCELYMFGQRLRARQSTSGGR
ncbi:protein of unknown function [Paraoerskovia marina]|uniref:DUF4395 domain-containing protein n=1 Tax=Paraoerskovia marina TaxID=545619 RepID=A0A1H1PRS3_9CELL|nr:DUF4395 domain-containing protein [Paraoerskovia marina]SDS13864.1 protein of unknown function [Paraoerskovia marina]